MARTNIAVDKRVFDEFSAEAERQDKTLYAFANDSLSVMTKVSSEGGSPSDIYGIWRASVLLKEIDVVTLPADFVDELVAILSATGKGQLLKMFSDLGSRVVTILKIAAADLPELSRLAKDFGGLPPVKQLTITEQAGKGVVEIDIIGAGRRIESTECAREFLISIVKGYGYSLVKQETNVGTIRLWVTRKNF